MIVVHANGADAASGERVGARLLPPPTSTRSPAASSASSRACAVEDEDDPNVGEEMRRMIGSLLRWVAFDVAVEDRDRWLREARETPTLSFVAIGECARLLSASGFVLAESGVGEVVDIARAVARAGALLSRDSVDAFIAEASL